jgi:hypothetical protein
MDFRKVLATKKNTFLKLLPDAHNSAAGGDDPGLQDFSWCKHTKTGKIYQMTTNYTKRP